MGGGVVGLVYLSLGALISMQTGIKMIQVRITHSLGTGPDCRMPSQKNCTVFIFGWTRGATDKLQMMN